MPIKRRGSTPPEVVALKAACGKVDGWTWYPNHGGSWAFRHIPKPGDHMGWVQWQTKEGSYYAVFWPNGDGRLGEYCGEYEDPATAMRAVDEHYKNRGKKEGK